MNFKEHAKSCQEAYLNDLNTLVSIESTRDLSTATKNAPFGQNCRKVLDAMLDMAKKDGFVTKISMAMQVLSNMEKEKIHLEF